MKFKIIAIALCMLFGGQLAKAQVKVTEIVKEWERSKAYTKEYLDAMPETGYSLKPTSQMRSFAEQMLHIADANYGLASSALNVKSPVELGSLEKSTDKSKSNVIRLVMNSYDYIISSINKMTDAQLNEPVKMIGSFDMDKRTGLAKTLEHQAHHRGQTTVYLRLAGVTPPQEKLF
ncbi:DinB family protein [Mucilaginibacter auburnensis]|uniref:Putative damage-inducible protein DinB n=1 Tax=Mucilaginibacter auburnensis TaxID=1457233 RepID=A0A2H9VUI8_9SPHI|nr:DinB family protein [Mucilaginibacter auburnensis]PJJ84503.1 putative damage-inducible protein DinB [Mucilaginibacter auburnensis]